jgi:phenylacetyl-CoA:acceptor oxidoreductase subunit 2
MSVRFDNPDRAEPWAQRHWDLRAAGNFIGGGTGTGFLVLAAIAVLAGSKTVLPFIVIGLGFVALGLFCVWLEIGRMWRAANVIFHPQTSWMTREALVAAPLFAVGLFAILFNDRMALVATAVVGLVFLYCQARILQASKGIPAWRHPLVVPLIIATGLAEGAGLMGVIGWFVIDDRFYLQFLPPLFAVLLVARFLVWRTYLRRLGREGAPARTLEVFRHYQPMIFGFGHLAPFVLFLMGYIISGRSALLSVMLGGAMALVGGWLIKVVLITHAAYNQGFQLPKVPVRGVGSPRPGVKPGWSEP